jgi:hypothetical protein
MTLLFAAPPVKSGPPKSTVDTREIRLVPHVDERVELLSIVFHQPPPAEFVALDISELLADVFTVRILS